MGRMFGEKKQLSASSHILILIMVIISIVLSAAGLFVVFKVETVRTLTITDQNTNEEYFSTPVETSYVLTYGWMHSLDRIPWTEQYLILDNNKLLLKKITVAAFGAGIPHNKGKVTKTEDGLIIMDEIDEEFDEINWIHSQTATEYIMLNDEIVLTGKDLPHHAPLRLHIEKRVKIWPR
ncbi:MAG: hypothetical protein HPY66_1762 [Firmicutes bacterium]|nr:hypothetical protein [Bacillota bacterium]MDI6706562.1 DUF1850 domain-containing protein [Bacillota bacterium]